MRRAIVATATAMALCGVAGIAQQAQQKPNAMQAAKATNPDFERIKGLVGQWEGTMKSNGQRATTSYKVTALGSAVENRLGEGAPEEMVTMFHLDGPTVMVTHYCAAGNQPRMVLKPSGDPKKLAFGFKDVTNLSSPDATHMRELVITFIDADHHRQEWTARSKGKDATEVFEFARKK